MGKNPFEKIQEGIDAYLDFKNVEDNPYKSGSIEHSDWEYGFIRERAIDNYDIVFEKHM